MHSTTGSQLGGKYLTCSVYMGGKSMQQRKLELPKYEETPGGKYFGFFLAFQGPNLYKRPDL